MSNIAFSLINLMGSIAISLAFIFYIFSVLVESKSKKLNDKMLKFSKNKIIDIEEYNKRKEIKRNLIDIVQLDDILTDNNSLNDSLKEIIDLNINYNLILSDISNISRNESIFFRTTSDYNADTEEKLVVDFIYKLIDTKVKYPLTDKLNNYYYIILQSKALPMCEGNNKQIFLEEIVTIFLEEMKKEDNSDLLNII